MSKAREFASSSDAPQGGSDKNYQSLVQEIQSLRRDASGVGKTADVSSDLSALNQHLHDMGVLPSLTIEQHGNNGQSHQHHGCGHHGAEGHSHRSHPGHSGHHDSAVDLMHKQIDRLDKDTQDKDKSRLSHDLQNFNRLLHSLGMPREFQLELVSTSPEPGSGGGSRSTSGSDSGTGSTTQNGKPPSEISNPTEPNNPSNSDNPGDSSGPSQPTPTIEPVDSPPATLSPTPAGLPGDGSLSAAVGGSKSVHLKNGVYTFSNFNGSTHAGDTLPASISFSGSGMNSTVIEMNRDTSTHAREIPTTDGTTTNPFYLLKVEGGSPTLSNFTLAGTDQGHLYNGLRMDHTSNALVKDVKVTHIPGNSRVNPGETFAINDQHGVNDTYDGIQIDGQGVGASGFASNGSKNVTVENAILTNNPYSAGATFWETENVNVENTSTSNNRTGLNFERVSGTIHIDNVSFSGNTGHDIGINNDQGSARVIITNPHLAPGQKLTIYVGKKEQGNTNLQKKSDIEVIENGKDVTDQVVKWV